MDDVGVGSVLVVPFGRRKVVGVSSAWPIEATCRTVAWPSRSRLSRPVCRRSWSELGRWVGEEYCSTTGRGLGLVLPPGVGTGAEARRVRPLVELEVEATPDGIAAADGGERLGLRQKAVLRALISRPPDGSPAGRDGRV